MSYSEEKEGLTRSFRSQVGYGTASTSASSKKFVPKTRKLISKKVSRADTLIGIALKYGITVQDLKRENRLWTNDSLFLRETLLIPLTPDNEDVLDPDDIIVSVDGNSILSNHQSSSSSQSSQDQCGQSNSCSAVLNVECETGGSSNHPPDPSSSSSSSHNLNLKQSRSSSSSSSALSSSLSFSSSSAAASSVNNQFNGGKNSNTAATNGGDSSIINDASSSGGTSSMHSSSHSFVNPSVSSPSSSSVIGDGSGDFFSKYDLSIAQLKGNVARMENNASTTPSLPSMDVNPLSLPPAPYHATRTASSRCSSTSSNNSSSIGRRSRRTSSPPSRRGTNLSITDGGDDDHDDTTTTMQDNDPSLRGPNDSPVLMIRSRINQRLIKSTLERSQQASDEIFEL